MSDSCEEDRGELPCALGGLVLGSPGFRLTPSDYSLELGLVKYLMALGTVSCLVGDRFYPLSIPRDPTAVYPAVTYYRSGSDPGFGLSGSMGFDWAEMSLDVWGTNYGQVIQAAEAIRLGLQGFSGLFGYLKIGSVLLEDQSDQKEKPGDGSGTWYFSRSLDYKILYSVTIPSF